MYRTFILKKMWTNDWTNYTSTKKFTMKVFVVMCLVFIQHCAAINIEDINLSNCKDGEFCEDSTTDSRSTQSINPVTEVTSQDNSFVTESNKNVNTTSSISQTTLKPLSTTATPVSSTTPINELDHRIGPIIRNQSGTCMCDIKILSCDINCCCDVDCNDFQISVFSHCDNHRPKKYDSRYCYTKNFIKRNNTQFILERLANNLFCIAYDNLPPIYGMSDVPHLGNRKVFEKTKNSVNLKKYTWDWHDSIISPRFNFSSRYHDKDVVWKFQNNILKTIELPQSGLTSRCTFGKTLKYLENSRWSCMQTDLSDKNPYLFSKIYNDFTVISSPHALNASHITSENHTCPSNVCLPLRNHYCQVQSWNYCNGTKPLEQACENGNCRNIVKRIRYTIVHNGTAGIQNIKIQLGLDDAAKKFYQHFEIVYEWLGELGGKKLSRSGNPGYSIGRPIVIGSLVTNVANDEAHEQIVANVSNYYLTLPLGRKSGNCDSEERHVVDFGEDVRLKCHVELKTENFSSETCVKLQNLTLEHMLQDSLRNVTAFEKYKTFVSKTGDFLTNDTSNWTRILLDRIPRHVVTGQIIDDKAHCSGLVTSMRLEILHTILPNHEDADNHKIAGVALTFAEPTDVSWFKCVDPNCTDVLRIELLCFVTFTDISTPSMYYYAGGPNLDISLPYDFFYPFMSSVSKIEPLNLKFVLSMWSILYFI